MEPLEYLRVFRRRWRIVAASLAVAAAAALVTAPTGGRPAGQDGEESTQPFQATHTLSTDTPDDLSWAATHTRADEVARRTAEELEIQTDGGDVPGLAQVEENAENGTIAITVTHSDPDRAVTIADTYAANAMDYVDEQRNARLERRSEAIRAAIVRQQDRLRELEDQRARAPEGSIDARLAEADRSAAVNAYSSLQNQLAQLQTEMATSVLYSLDQAQATRRSAAESDGGFGPGPGRSERLPYALAVGLMLGLGLALLVERVDTRIHTRREAEHAFGLPVVADIPNIRRGRWFGGGDQVGPDPDLTDVYGRLRVALLHMRRWRLTPRPPVAGSRPADPDPPVPLDPASSVRVVLVASATRREGRTSVAVNLAASLAAAGKQVAVVDCDHQRSTLAERIGSRDGSSPVHGGLRLEPTGWVLYESSFHHLDVVTAPPSMDHHDRATSASAALKASLNLVDVVVVDTGPLLTTVDGTALVPEADAVVMVARSGHVNGEEAREARDLLANLQAPVVGVALLGGRGPSVGTRIRALRNRVSRSGPDEYTVTADAELQDRDGVRGDMVPSRQQPEVDAEMEPEQEDKAGAREGTTALVTDARGRPEPSEAEPTERIDSEPGATEPSEADRSGDDDRRGGKPFARIYVSRSKDGDLP